MITIREAVSEDYEQIEIIMQQVQQMHVAWRPDVYCACSPVLSEEFFNHILQEQSVFI